MSSNESKNELFEKFKKNIRFERAPNLKEERLYERKFNFISEVTIFLFLHSDSQGFRINVAKLILLTIKAPLTMFLDKIFLEDYNLIYKMVDKLNYQNILNKIQFFIQTIQHLGNKEKMQYNNLKEHFNNHLMSLTDSFNKIFSKKNIKLNKNIRKCGYGLIFKKIHFFIQNYPYSTNKEKIKYNNLDRYFIKYYSKVIR
ncbi:MAG: hypothetical protein ACFFAN_04255 [Promethearchaeota archaeon]